MTDEASLILIVDDNSQNLQFLGNFLMSKGYQLGFAKNGVEAIKFVKERQPDLILLDIMMPEMDGFETCRTLKGDINFRHIPVIFLTARSETEDIVKGFKVGGVDYVTKPFISEELLARIETHIQMKVLKGLLPVCAKCKKIRDEKGFWNQMESYFQKHTNAEFTHGICGECSEELYGDSEWYKRAKSEGKL